MAFHDTRRLDVAIVEGHVCIIGAGAAGITLARALAKNNRRVILVESGDFQFEHRTQALYLGENAGLRNYSTAVSRLRRFGGSTTRWAGQCRPLDAIDFEQREGIPDSGWPITRTELEPYYHSAHSVCRIEDDDYSLPPSVNASRESHDSRLETRIFHFGFPTDFGRLYRKELESHPDVHIYLNANAIEIELDERAAQMIGLRVATFNGRSVQFKATTYILACGGIENARLLLASNRVVAAGVGNQHDLVGRYFMDHPYFVPGYIQPLGGAFERSPYVIEDYTRVGLEQKSIAAWSLREEEIRRDRLNSCALFLVRKPAYKCAPEYTSAAGRSFVRLIDVLRHRDLPDRWTMHDVSNVVSGGKYIGRLLGRQLNHLVRPRWALTLQAILEATPTPDSRVTLGTHRDRFDMPRVRVQWRLNPTDKRGLESLVATVREELFRLKLGTFVEDLARDEDGWPASRAGGRHHMGTTRMHWSERRGVVDANCRIHGCENLFVAGSSVFPTCGYANPTLTIVALALRLAEHLTSRFR